ncbi:GIY-YIG nuclease family protein [Shewanella insulae]|uniref:GIY-YIG nuclease family protein n=1 Tax=Shewanella insulae TaxID=2681496 RepID=UPI001EFC8E06|nr:GIY-YIG nuclease family protein [Shewanella insulae]MCG9736967.1 GIY-YIG nuclease family protein [Shewanella insulae]
MNRLITLTEERLTKAKTAKGGYNKAQLQVIGVDWPPIAGWKKSLIGKRITLNQFVEFVRASKNEIYLHQIESLLPTLTPPIEHIRAVTPPIEYVGDVSLAINAKVTSMPKLSKNELKRERTVAKRANRSFEREYRIRTFGIHKCVKVLLEKASRTLYYIEKQFLDSLANRDDDLIRSDEISKLYLTMRKHGLVLTSTANGLIALSGFTKASQLYRAQLLYVIRQKGTGYCKIGVSKEPTKRMQALQTSSPIKLELSLIVETKTNALKLEKSLHKAFYKQRSSGEWFYGISDKSIIKAVAHRGTVIKGL